MWNSRVALFLRIQFFTVSLLSASAAASIAVGKGQQASMHKEPSFYGPAKQHVVHMQECYPQPAQEQPHTLSGGPPSPTTTYSASEANILKDLHFALSAMQDHYFEVWLGKYTTAIDWTAAVMSTHVSATLSTLSQSLSYTMPGTFDGSRKLDVEAQMVENEINKYFAQTTSYYFGEDHFAIRMQAYDDMLWVVLGWLESTRFIESHSVGHYGNSGVGAKNWHASQFIPAFAHRARVFYGIAERGWDWKLCGGGMTWNPRLLPYKNAITNQLFISASISMYLHFSGDENCSPFFSQYDKSMPQTEDLMDGCDENSRGRYDPVYLANAVKGYEWLKSSGMTNEQGLYTDGFHIGGYPGKTKCNERNEMVYTYNQGVILSGLRELWEATGKESYLEDGHELIRNVIHATGWTESTLFSDPEYTPQDREKRTQAIPNNWAGLGSRGILTEFCDPSGRCSQDGQTFKGIFFHHFTSFCAPLPARPTRPGKTHTATREVAMLHAQSCKEYTPWVVRNARAALSTRDAEGRFGAWWGAPSDEVQDEQHMSYEDPALPEGAVDYRNVRAHAQDQVYFENDRRDSSVPNDNRLSGDLNDRGRGRTIESQGSGLAVVRAMWEFLRRGDGDVGESGF